MVKIYVEGGGETNDLKTRCRKGFSTFFAKAGFEGRMPSVLPCGGRKAAYDRFCTALVDEETAILLVDAEAPVTENTAWGHLASRPGDGWAKPNGADDDQCHLMVQCMETWFLCDVETLKIYFRNEFDEHQIPNTTNIEAIEKDAAIKALENATHQRGFKKRYGKGKDSFKILEKIDPNKVFARSPWAVKLKEAISSYCTAR